MWIFNNTFILGDFILEYFIILLSLFVIFFFIIQWNIERIVKKDIIRLIKEISKDTDLNNDVSNLNLDAATIAQLDRGRVVTEVLKQLQYEPMSMGKQVSIMYAVTNGYLDDVPQDKIKDFEIAFHRYMETSHSDVISTIIEKRELDDDVSGSLISAITEFKKTGVY